jgi:hypothetical protein
MIDDNPLNGVRGPRAMSVVHQKKEPGATSVSLVLTFTEITVPTGRDTSPCPRSCRPWEACYNFGRGDDIACGKIFLKGIPVSLIFIDSARKAIEWVIRCCTMKIPILCIRNSPGYMVGAAGEYVESGIGGWR